MPKFNVPMGDLDRWIKKYSDENDEILEYSRSLGMDLLVMYYEDMLNAEDQFFRQILSFLEVPLMQTSSSMIKHTSDDLSEVINNFDEVLDHYRNTEYENMVLDGFKS